MIKRFLASFLLLLLSIHSKAEPVFSRQTTAPKARVVIATDPTATSAFQADAVSVRILVKSGLLRFTGKTNEASAWRTLVSTNDSVGIKVYSSPGANSGTRPSVVAAIVEGLLAAGVPAKKIIIWDKELTPLRLAGFDEIANRYGVRLAASAVAGYDDQHFYESPLIGNLVWGDSEFGKKTNSVGRNSYVTRLVTQEMTKIISVVPLLNHNLAGTTGNIYSLALGGVDNTQRFEQGDRFSTALPEIYALPSLGDKVVLNITDALICQYQGEQRSLLHYSTMLNQIWFSKDPVALDVLALRELDRQRALANAPANKINWDIYHNASLLELGVSDLKSLQIETVP